MKKLSITLTSVILSFIMALMIPVHAFASSVNGSSAEYISEVKVGYGKKSADAENGLKGYTILKDENGNYADLNQGSGGGTGSKGSEFVFLGYKTTTDPNQAITDLAVMNMKGGYKIKDYESLMDNQMKSQIIPFVDNFHSALEEYRLNYSSDNAKNKARAQYVHDCLNKLTDDDCAGAGLGDLLLAKTKYEMGDEYNALSDTEKNQHADILTIIAQANGKATLMFENLVTKAADSGDDTWLERMSNLEYDDMIDGTGLSPNKAKQELDKKYYDDASDMLEMWNKFGEELGTYDSAKETFENFDQEAYQKAMDDMNNMDPNADDETSEKIIEAYDEAMQKYTEYLRCIELISIYEYLESIEYGDGTLLDYFKAEQDDPTALYPFIASLSDGQRAGLDFVSIHELAVSAITDEEGYASINDNESDPVSIYEDVDRDIYKPGGVALTSDAIRNDVTDIAEETKGGISGLTIAMYVLTGVSAVAMIASKIVASRTMSAVRDLPARIQTYTTNMIMTNQAVKSTFQEKLIAYGANRGRYVARSELEVAYGSASRRAAMCNKMAIGCGVAMIILAGISVYLTWRDLTAKYKVDFSQIPAYIVDEKDITAYNSKGEKIVIKNQSAYYKAVETNRNEGDDWYDILGTKSDLNGGVGKQWLALYSVKNEAGMPILASSLKVVRNDANVPSGYETGIHMFGTETAANLNNPLYTFSEGTSAYIYFKTDENAKNTNDTGSIFTGGYMALAAAAGLGLGILGTVLVTKIKKKKKTDQ